MTTIQTTLGHLRMEEAKKEDLGAVIQIIDEAAAWLHSKGITRQWPSPTPKEFRDRMEKDIAQREVYLAYLENIDEAVGTLRFEWCDMELWQCEQEDGGYIHSFATRDGVRRRGVGAAMLAWAREHVRTRGKQYLRLDCWGGNRALCQYYKQTGFTFCGFVREGNWVDALFQMEA
jgi:GNAT superfamily N-acetyltransferase